MPTSSSTSGYGFGVTLPTSFDDAVARVTAALHAEGFGVVTTMDVAAIMKSKLGVDMMPYLILGACHPQLAHRALMSEPDVGLLLPCNVVVRQVTGGIQVDFADPQALMSIVPSEALRGVAAEARAGLQRVAAAIQAEPS